MPPRFLDRLDLVHVGFGPRPYVTLAPLRYQDADGTVYMVPQDYATDLASIPWVIRALPFVGHGKEGGWDKAAVVHDWLCIVRILPSAETHRLFGRALSILPIPWVQQQALSLAVRWFGPRWPDP